MISDSESRDVSCRVICMEIKYIYQLDDLIIYALSFYNIHSSMPPFCSVLCFVDNLVNSHHHYHYYYTTPRL